MFFKLTLKNSKKFQIFWSTKKKDVEDLSTQIPIATCKLDVAMVRGLMSCRRWDLTNSIVMVGLIKDGSGSHFL
jgi:hypothetical protein